MDKIILSKLELKQVLMLIQTDGRICPDECLCFKCVFKNDEDFNVDACVWVDDNNLEQKARGKLLNSTYFESLTLVDILELFGNSF